MPERAAGQTADIASSATVLFRICTSTRGAAGARVVEQRQRQPAGAATGGVAVNEVLRDQRGRRVAGVEENLERRRRGPGDAVVPEDVAFEDGRRFESSAIAPAFGCVAEPERSFASTVLPIRVATRPSAEGPKNMTGATACALHRSSGRVPVMRLFGQQRGGVRPVYPRAQVPGDHIAPQRRRRRRHEQHAQPHAYPAAGRTVTNRKALEHSSPCSPALMKANRSRPALAAIEHRRPGALPRLRTVIALPRKSMIFEVGAGSLPPPYPRLSRRVDRSLDRGHVGRYMQHTLRPGGHSQQANQEDEDTHRTPETPFRRVLAPLSACWSSGFPRLRCRILGRRGLYSPKRKLPQQQRIQAQDDACRDPSRHPRPQRARELAHHVLAAGQQKQWNRTQRAAQTKALPATGSEFSTGRAPPRSRSARE